ncbi:hypothetical protein COCVIDRAFT_104624 [Bipolaris victoriae FI3]|uniref:Uncharacterized protein n=2 Tax=Bipolaris TaxID=33194 RepID=W6YEP4_COCC2|nr:uncharacterized protein COCCADRAFT_84239 [Bipolaris zeicola 26-R-13]XP_014554576.1 hypothetical protein COCVIDRAFT_104624 [Bipolaris victoriae FI3]EUC37942.1 hypothetical protein COCCADRAFT_84239 [Bipolaris zeicola 26-R-13]
MCAVHGSKDILTYVPFFSLSLLEICRQVAIKCGGNAARRLTAYRPLSAATSRIKKSAKGGNKKRAPTGPRQYSRHGAGTCANDHVMRRGHYQQPTPTPPKIAGTAYLTWLAVVACSLLGDRLRTCASHEPVVDSTGTHRAGWSTKERYDLAPVSLLTRPHDGRCSIKHNFNTDTLFKLSFSLPRRFSP